MKSANPQTATGQHASAADPSPFSFARRLQEIGMFFDGSDRVHQAMRRVADLFEQHHIPYAIVGGMAVNAHRHPRTTQDVDFLVRPESLPVLRELASRGALQPDATRSKRFFEPATGVRFDVLVTGGFPGSGDPGPIAFPDPLATSELHDDLRVVNLATLVELKLAAHRFQDFADVVSLIRANDLDESFANGLHNTVRADFIECLEEKRREDAYDRKQSGG